MLKETLNKLAVIASAETKFLQATFADLDKLHRDAFEKAKAKASSKDMERERDSVALTPLSPLSSDDEVNIFLNDSDKDRLM